MNQPLPCLPTLGSEPKRSPLVRKLPNPASATSFPGRAAAARSRWSLLHELGHRLTVRGLGVVSACLGPRSACGFGILMYHRVAIPPTGAPFPTWNVVPARFREQMQGLLRRGYRPWPLRKVLAHHEAGQSIPPQTFVVTFDDGYENVYRQAFPILREYGVPATVFLATAYLNSDGPFPFDDWACAGSLGVPGESWRPLTTAQCEEMLASGLIELGSHTHIHADFRHQPEDLRRDLAISLKVLRTTFGNREATFAFPFGYGCRRHDGPEMSDAVKEAGMLGALTTESELIKAGDDPFNWGRFAVLETDTAASLAAKLGGWYSLARSAWQGLRWRANRGRQSVCKGTTSCSRG